MKREQKNKKNSLRVSSEVIHLLSAPQLAEVAAGVAYVSVKTYCYTCPTY
jgi:hypothetical protein